MIKVVLAEDHKAMIEGIELFLEFDDEIKIVGIASSGDELLCLIEKKPVDVAIVDIRMPKMGGIEATETLKKTHPHIKVIAFTTFDDLYAYRKMKAAGASGYLLKKTSLKELKKAILLVAKNQEYKDPNLNGLQEKDFYNSKTLLTKRQKEILALIARRKTNQEIADLLFISKMTVATHRRDMISRLGLEGPAALQAYASEQKFKFNDL